MGWPTTKSTKNVFCALASILGCCLFLWGNRWHFLKKQKHHNGTLISGNRGFARTKKRHSHHGLLRGLGGGFGRHEISAKSLLEATPPLRAADSLGTVQITTLGCNPGFSWMHLLNLLPLFSSVCLVDKATQWGLVKEFHFLPQALVLRGRHLHPLIMISCCLSVLET